MEILYGVIGSAIITVIVSLFSPTLAFFVAVFLGIGLVVNVKERITARRALSRRGTLPVPMAGAMPPRVMDAEYAEYVELEIVQRRHQSPVRNTRQDITPRERTQSRQTAQHETPRHVHHHHHHERQDRGQNHIVRAVEVLEKERLNSR